MPFEKGKIPKGSTPFKPGQSGNPNGRPRKLPQLDKLLAEVLGDEKDGKTAAERVLIALQKKAEKGDVRAAEVLLDRGYGKAIQTVQNIEIERKKIDDLFPSDDEIK